MVATAVAQAAGLVAEDTRNLAIVEAFVCFQV